jgi:hypothetical protein
LRGRRHLAPLVPNLLQATDIRLHGPISSPAARNL